MRALPLCWYGLSWPAGFDIDAAMVFTRLLATRPLHGLFRRPDPLVCEIVATPAGLGWRLGMTAREAALLVPQVRHQLPAVGITAADRDLPPVEWAVELRLDTATRPLRTDIPETVTAALLGALAGVHQDEALVWSWVIGPPLARPPVQMGDTADLRGEPLTADEAAALRAKLAEPLYGAVARIGVHAHDQARRIRLAQGVLGALELARSPGAAFSIRRVSARRAAHRLTAHHGPAWSWPVTINAAELAAVAGLPVGNPHLPGVTYNGHRQLPPNPDNTVPEAVAAAVPAGRYRIVGAATYGGGGQLLHLPTADALHHLHIVGPTGSGKSVLVARLISADIAAGRSVVVIEPKADLIAAVVDSIPPARTGDVVLIDPTDTTHAVGLNVLAGNPELAADRFSALVRGLWPDAWGPRTGQLLYSAALTLARTGGTLADLPRLLTDPAYRHQLTTQHPDPLGVSPFWDSFDQLTNSGRAAVTGPALNRLAAFTQRPALRAMIAQPAPPFDLADIFTRPRIVAVNAAKGAVGPESARLVGALVLSQLWEATLARASTTPAEDRSPVMVYVDEFHDYTAGLPIDLGDVLGQARGLGLAVTLAHQSLSQLDTATRAGVLANARSRIVFQTVSGTDDARTLAPALGPGELVTPDDLAALGPFHAYAALVAGHATRPPASLTTMPPDPPAGTTAAVRAASRHHYAHPIAATDADLLARHHTNNDQPAALGGQRPRQPQ